MRLSECQPTDNLLLVWQHADRKTADRIMNSYRYEIYPTSYAGCSNGLLTKAACPILSKQVIFSVIA
ncbi:MAG TPA: hypothetical protein PKD90_15655 [Phnomibacter sp.]|nr:hypothetical protein [Phnomibacter sp.]